MTRHRNGSAAIIVIILLGVGAGAVATSPDTAEAVMPAQMLPMLPQFEQVDTDTSCENIEEGSEAVNNWVPDAILGDEELDPDAVKERLCDFQCTDGQSTAGTYCADDSLACVCRTADDA